MDLTKAKVLPAAPLPGGGDPKFPGPPAGGLVGIVDPAAQLTLPPPAEGIAATMSLTLERRKETALLRGSNLSYNEGVIGLTGHCLSFHARTGKL